MVLASVRRFAWLLILVLVTGLFMPMLASAAPCDDTPGISTHTHADGTVHSHSVRTEQPGVGKAVDHDSGKASHCPGCMTNAACAVSCLGLAVLPVTVNSLPLSSATAWNPETTHVLPGVAPPGDIDPPRPVFRS